MIIPIILAAGRGKRFGTENKLLFELHGKPMIQHSLEVFLEFFNKVVVVLGNDKKAMISYLTSLDKNEIFIVNNDNWLEGGMSSSVKIGVEYVETTIHPAGVFIHPGDIPFITKNDIELILKSIKETEYTKIVIPQYQSRNGHPLFVPRIYFSEITKIRESSEGLKGFLKENSINKHFVNCGKGILRDIDTKENI